MPNIRPQLVALMPPIRGAGRPDAALERLLARGRLRRHDPREPRLVRLAGRLGAVPPAGGFAALRLWGQTGERPTDWLAAADAVSLEARLDHVRLHAVAPDEVTDSELGELYDALQQALGSGSQTEFLHLGGCGYVRDPEGFTTPAAPPETVSGSRPDPWLPDGPRAAPYHRLSTEIQMCLHGHPLNAAREQAGRRPLNALWLWGGGRAPAPAATALPPLFATDPLIAGFWHAGTARCRPWPGSVAACIDAAGGDCVVELPDLDAVDAAARRLIRGDLAALTLLSADGFDIELRARDRLRVWRRRLALPGEPG